MAILRQLNEFIRESVVLALEPGRRCVASCSYCFATLNSDIQKNNRTKSLKDDSTFERLLEKAYSPYYDPTSFLQWGLRSKLVLGFANTCEPFQAVTQAVGILKACDNFSIPLFIQSKGVNFKQVQDYLKPFHDNSSIFISIPSLDNHVAQRFEPGTPSIQERLDMMAWFVDNGFYVIGAISPFHEDWIKEPAKLIYTLAQIGVSEIFVDRLHLNQRQFGVAKDRVMADMAGGRMREWPQKALDWFFAMYDTAIENDLEFYNSGFMGTCYGKYNTLPTISPDSCFSRGKAWPYHDGGIFHFLEQSFYDDDINPVERDFNDSIVLTWDDALHAMEADGKIDQAFSYSGLMDIIPIYKKISPSWKRSIGITSTKSCAPMSDWFNCLWNNPYRNQFVWRHPWLLGACDQDGIPIQDSDGNFVLLFDPDYDKKPTKRYFRKIDSLDQFRRLEKDAV